jgi:RNA polymerase sigma-70 factor (ECF subfamily)
MSSPNPSVEREPVDEPQDQNANVRALNARRADRELVSAVVAGECAAFERLHDLYRGRVYAFAVKRLRVAAEADDVCQDVFLQVYRCIGSFEGRSSLLTWIFGIAHHQVCRRLRRRRLEAYSLDAPEAAEVEAPHVPADRQIDAARVLSGCTEVLEESVTGTQREVFRLYYGENHSTREIAEQLGKSRQAVKISLFRTRRTLAAGLEERGLSQSAA